MILEALNYAATWPLTRAEHRAFIRSSVNLWARANRCAVALPMPVEQPVMRMALDAEGLTRLCYPRRWPKSTWIH